MIISKTPLRISFVGGGTDIADYYQAGRGAVVSAAINKYIYVTVHKRFDSSLRVSYTQTEIVNHADELEHSLVRACLEMAGIDSGIEITSIGEVPAGTGLGSSSALTVGLLNALYTYQGINLSSQELLDKACEIEINRLHQPIGKQDQAAASFGGLNHFSCHANGAVERRRLELSPEDFSRLESQLVLFYTGVTHAAGEILQDQRQDMEKKRRAMDEMRDQADRLYDRLETEGFGPYFGQLLRDGWERKRTLSGKITNSEIDRLYQAGLDAGATGGKLLGAGGGGFLLFYCEQEKQDALRAALNLRQMPFRVARYGSRIVYFS